MLILGVVFVMTSISIFLRSKKVRVNCTKKVVATVVAIKQEDLNQTPPVFRVSHHNFLEVSF